MVFKAKRGIRKSQHHLLVSQLRMETSISFSFDIVLNKNLRSFVLATAHSLP